MNQLRWLRSGYFLYVAFLLTFYGCAQIGIQPQTFNEKLAVAVTSVTAIRASATALVQAKKITADDGQNVQNQADTARQGLDLARTINATNPQGAADKLGAASAVLTALQGYLASKGAK